MFCYIFFVFCERLISLQEKIFSFLYKKTNEYLKFNHQILMCNETEFVITLS